MRVGAAVLAMALLVAACGGGGADRQAGTSTTTDGDELSPVTDRPPAEHRVVVDGGAFVERATGEPFVPRGVNLIRFAGGRDAFLSPDVFDRAEVDATFAALAERGYNTVRLFLDACPVGPACMTQEGVAGIDGAYLDVVAETLELAAGHDLVLLLTLNDLPDGGGYRAISARDDSEVFPGYRNSDFLTASGHEAMVAVWRDLLEGLVARGARLDVVLGWSILNEHWLFEAEPPLSSRSGEVTTATGTYDMADPDQRRAMVVDATRALVAAVAGEIRRHDPHGLVTMGFFAPAFPHATDIGGDWYVDTAPLVEDSALDFFDFHAYPGEDITLDQIAENFGLDGAKPVVMGEVGAFVDRYPTVDAAALATQQWVARSCELGFDGWLYWSHDRLPMADATWSFTEAGGYLLDVLSPREQPDPCTPTLVDPDLAHGRPVTVSRHLPDGPPDAAVDGSPDTAWWSGAGAPQWIEVALDAPSAVGGVRLRVDQDPAGRTVHVVEARDASGALRELHRFQGETSFGDVLEVVFPEPVEAVTAVRVRTVSSPSWVSWSELQVLAP